MNAQPQSLPILPIHAALARMRTAGLGLLLDARGKWAFCDLRQSAEWAMQEFGGDDPLASQVVLHCDSIGIECDTLEQAVRDGIEWLDGKRAEKRTAAREYASALSAESRACELEYQRDCMEDR